MQGKRWILPGAIWVLLMMFARNYLMAHYPSDVLFGLLIGVFSGFVAAWITILIYRFLESRSGESKFADFVLYTGIEQLPNPKDLKLRSRKASEDAPAASHVSVRHSSSHASDKKAESSVIYRGKH